MRSHEPPGALLGAIAGIIHLEGEAPLLDQVRQLGHGLGHRGPDDKGVTADGRAAFAHRRTRFTQRDAREPLVTPDVVVLMDGRPYNGGVDVIAERWSSGGVASLSEIDGPFALAIWDRKKESLIVARDALGRRPLYYAQKGTRLAFASETTPLLGLPWVSRELALDHLSEYLSFRYVHAPRTLLQDVAALPPGHLLRFDRRGLRIERWHRTRWAGPDEPMPDPLAAERRIDSLLRRSVQKRLRRLRRRCCCRVGSTRRRFSAMPRTLGFGFRVSPSPFRGERVDESGLAARVAGVFGADHHILRIDDREIVDLLPEHRGRWDSLCPRRRRSSRCSVSTDSTRCACAAVGRRWR